MRPEILTNWWLSGGQIDKIDLSGITNIVAVGDSFMVGANSTPSGGTAADYTNSFINLYKAEKEISTIQNIAVGGKGTLTMIQNIKNLAYTSLSSLMVVNIGLNEVRRGGDGSKTLKQIEAGYLYYLQKHLAINRVFSGSSSVTRTGTFSNTNFQSYGAVGTSGTLPASTRTSFTTTLNSQWEYTFTGTNVGFIFMASDGVIGTGYGRFEVYIDDTLISTEQAEGVWYSGIAELGNAPILTNQLGPVPYIIHGLTNTTHTVKIKNIDSGLATTLDYFFQLDTPSNTGPIMFMEIPYITTLGYSMYSGVVPPHNNGTAAKSDTASAVIQSIVTEYRSLGYDIVFVPTNQYFSTSNVDPADEVHPNNAGHVEIYNALLYKTL